MITDQTEPTWADVARRKYDHYKTFADSTDPQYEIAIHVHERQLAKLVPHLLDEIARLSTIVRAVTNLTCDTDGGDLDPDSALPVGEFMRALHDPEGGLNTR